MKINEITCDIICKKIIILLFLVSILTFPACNPSGDENAEMFSVEREFPEQHRSEFLNGVTYNYELCSEITADLLHSKNRVYYSELGNLGSLLRTKDTSTGRPVRCSGTVEGECYLKLIKFHVGTEIILNANSSLSCEDASQVVNTVLDERPTISCNLYADVDNSGKYSPAPDSSSLRGYIIVADKISIRSNMKTQHLNLVLIAKNDIEFMHIQMEEAMINTRADVFPMNPYGNPPDYPYLNDQGGVDGADGVPNILNGRHYGGAPLTGTDGEDGNEAKYSSGSVVLIAPEITGWGKINTRGAAGGNGGDGGDGFDYRCLESASSQPYNCIGLVYSSIEWRYTTERQCIPGGSCEDIVIPPHLNFTSFPGGPGGDGGSAGNGASGGNIILITDKVSPNIIFQYNGGKGFTGGEGASGVGLGGLGGQTYEISNSAFWDCFEDNTRPDYGQERAGNCISENIVSTGRHNNGTNGTNGTDGDSGILLQVPYNQHYVYAFAHRIADANLINGDYYARDSRIAAENKKAVDYYQETVEYFCSHEVRIIREEIPPVISDLPPLDLKNPVALPDTVPGRRDSACLEASTRLELLNRNMNYFKLPADDYYTYVLPDKVKVFRDGLFDTFKTYGSPASPAGYFWDNVSTINDINQRIMDLNIETEEATMSLQSKEKSVEIAAEKMTLHAQVLLTAFDKLEAANSEIAANRDRISDLTLYVQGEIQPKPCDITCQLGTMFSLVTTIASAISNVATLVGNFKSVLSNIKNISELGKIAKGVNFKSLASLSKVSEYTKKLFPGHGDSPFVTKAKELSEGIQSGDFYADQFAEMVQSSVEMNESIQDSLSNVYETIEYVEAHAANMTAPQAAIGHLMSIVDLLKRCQELNRELPVLNAEQLTASANYRISEMEYDLAFLEMENARTIKEMNAERLLSAGNPEKIEIVRDQACVDAKSLNDKVLLFDYLYWRARAFTSLEELAPNSEYKNFRKNLLKLNEYNAYEQAQVSFIFQDFLNEVDGISYVDSYSDRFCKNEYDCSSVIPAPSTADYDTISDKNRYGDNVVNELLSTGEASFEVCPGPGICHSNLLTHTNDGSHFKKRVVYFDIRFLQDPQYNLMGMNYRIDYSHGELATFLMSGDITSPLYPEYKDFIFNTEYAQKACETASAFAVNPSGIDCFSISHFADVVSSPPGIYNMNYYSLLDHTALDLHDHTNENIYGTSVLGTWKLDIKEMLRTINNPANDNCYIADGIPVDCYPLECYDDTGAKISDDSADILPYCMTNGAESLNERCAASMNSGFLDAGADPLCYKICGTSCKAFKDSIRGIEYAIYWRDGNDN